MIINIWAKQHLLRTYFLTKDKVTVTFPGWLFVWKPISVPTSGMYCYFTLDTNSEKVWNDYVWTTVKEWLFEFYICANDKNTPDVELFEALDTLSNAIITEQWSNISLDSFKVMYIIEWVQSWVLRDEENPYIIAQYRIGYKYLY